MLQEIEFSFIFIAVEENLTVNCLKFKFLLASLTLIKLHVCVFDYIDLFTAVYSNFLQKQSLFLTA